MSSSIVDKLNAVLDDTKVRTDDELLQERRHDYWVLSHLDDVQDRAAPKPACVVQPTCVEDVVAVVNTCRENNIPLIPFGLGSGVCGGVIASPDKVLIDMSEMNTMRSLDETNLLVTFDAGKNGGEAERDVAKRGLTIGHWPQSIDVSSVGGWVATRASGQFSTGYGNIEDIVYSIEVVLPDGSVVNLGKAPRAAAGPDLRHVIMGSEGTLGIITGVTLSLRRAAEASKHTAFFANDMHDGFDLQRAIIQSGWEPVVMRQYDGLEANRLFPDEARQDTALFFAVHEGPTSKVDAEVAGVTAIAEELGLEAAPVEIVNKWLHDRNHVPTWQNFIENGIVLDTIEISGGWDVIGKIYDDATKALSEISGNLVGSAHSSHVYRTGLNLYFTFVARPENPDDMAKIYTESWKRVIETTARHGGGVAHHHGIGRLRRDYLVHDLGESGIAMLQLIKKALDPTGFMNPGVQIPDA